MLELDNEYNPINVKACAVLSVDLEDYYHANYPGYDYTKLKTRISHLVEPTLKLLDILEETGAKITFFVLGEVARKYPDLVRRISNAGHEIACHGNNHRLITELGKAETISGITTSISLLEDITGQKVLGYRAPNFSAHLNRTHWLFEEIYKLGIFYDSSRFPAKTYYGGEPFMNNYPHIMPLKCGGKLWEVPVSSSNTPLVRFVWSGGFYWRILPLRIIVARTNRLIASGRPAVLYLHPKDIDAKNPDLPIGAISNWIHQVGTKKAEDKLRAMVRKIKFLPIIDILPRKTDAEKEKKENNRFKAAASII